MSSKYREASEDVAMPIVDNDLLVESVSDGKFIDRFRIRTILIARGGTGGFRGDSEAER